MGDRMDRSIERIFCIVIILDKVVECVIEHSIAARMAGQCFCDLLNIRASSIRPRIGWEGMGRDI